MNTTEKTLADLKVGDKAAIYDVLIREAGAPESLRESFIHNFPECREFGFQGKLGFGGKVYYNPSTGAVNVDCYAEDINPCRLDAIRATNGAINALLPKETNEDHQDH